MPTRSFKLNALGFSTTGNINISVSVNNSTVFSGNVPATLTSNTPSESDLYSLTRNQSNQMCDFTLDSTVNGTVPLSITVNTGDLYFSNLVSNYTAKVIRVISRGPDNNDIEQWEDITGDTTYDSILSENTDPVIGFDNLPGNPVVGKIYKLLPYGNDDLNSALSEYFVTPNYTNPDNDLALITDSITNVKINGVSFDRHTTDNKIHFVSDINKAVGFFKFKLQPGQTLTCDYYIDPATLIDPAGNLQNQINTLTPNEIYGKTNIKFAAN